MTADRTHARDMSEADWTRTVIDVLFTDPPYGIAYLAQALRAFLHRGEFARFHGLPELLAAVASVDPDRVTVEVVAGPRLRMEIHGEPGEAWNDYAAGPPECDRCIPDADGKPFDVGLATPQCDHVRRGTYLAEQPAIVSPPAVREAADQFLPRSSQ